MDSLEDSVIASLDGEDKALYPYLAYLLQDLWDMGSSPDDILRLLRNYTNIDGSLKLLDLGCGKGAVSIRLAKELSLHCHGIDALPEFIDDARNKAEVNHVESLCFFEVGDIRNHIEKLHDYDVVILGAIGPILGNLNNTLSRIRPCLTNNGYLIIDDAYIPDNSNLHNSLYLRRSEVTACFQKESFEVIAEDIPNRVDQMLNHERMFRCIHKRANELTLLYPENEEIFENYIQSQQNEISLLDNELICVTWLLQKQANQRLPAIKTAGFGFDHDLSAKR
jgi:cyclopropane fatty-acyl-phospholipid synthase-like methyltransferase